MIGSRTRLVIDIGRRLLRVVEAQIHRGHVEIIRALSIEAPETLETEDPRATGLWLADTLASSGCRATSAIFVVNREVASHKRLVLPTTHDEDLAGMTQLAMQRELGPAAEGAIIDFIPAGREESGSVVHAVAVPQREIDYIRNVASIAGLRVSRISLRTFGTALLLETLGEPVEEGSLQLGIDLTGEGLELSFVSNGEVRHSRGAEVGFQRDATAAADAAITEAKRSLAAWHVTQPEARLERALVLGDPSVAERVVRGAADAFGSLRILASHPRVVGRSETLAACWPLAGMLLQEALGRARFNLASPRRPPDLATRRRMRIYAVVGSAIVALLVGWTIGARQLRDLRDRAADLQEKATAALPESQRYKRDLYRSLHLAAWQEASPRWLELIMDLGGFAPDQTRVVLDLVNGTLEPGSSKLVREQGKDDRITVRRPVRLMLEGEAIERAAVDAVREALVRDSRYSLESPGTDRVGGKRLPIPFTFILRQADRSAPAAAPAAATTPVTGAAPATTGAPS